MQDAKHIQLSDEVSYASMGQIIGLNQRTELFVHVINCTGSDVSCPLLFQKNDAIEDQLGLSWQGLYHFFYSILFNLLSGRSNMILANDCGACSFSQFSGYTQEV